MIAPRYRRPPSSLSPEQVASLVRMREQGATWREIGRAFRKQDCACKSIFDKATGGKSMSNKADTHASAPA